jgi:predicted ABC-type ATPase
MENIFANGLYFKQNPDNILAEQKDGKSRYGKAITLYKGTLADLDRINAIANLTAVNYDDPLVSSKTVDIADLTDKDVEQIDNIENALSKSKSDVETKIKRDYKKLKNSNKPAETSMEGIETRTLQEVYNEINPEVSKDELQVFLWYCNQISKPVTNMEWFDIAGVTPSMLMSGFDNYKEKIKEWYEQGLVFYNGITKEIEPAWLYLSGDVYRKNSRVRKTEGTETGQDVEYIIENYGEKALQRQIEEIKKVFDMQYAKRLLINSSDKNSLKLLPNSSFSKNFFIKTLADEAPFKWKQISASSDKRYGQMDFLDTKYYSDWKKTTYAELNLRDAFCYWMVTDKTIQFKKGITYADIINYYVFAKQKPKTSAVKDADGRYTGEELIIKQKEDAAFERMKSKSKQEGDRLFAIFIDKMLLQNDKIRIESEWNMTFNNNVAINYNKIPVAFRMNKFIDGQPSDVRFEKREAVAFTLSNGSGLLAFDVGVGKTPSAIFTISAFIDLGWSKRPVVIVPNQTYKQWISEFKKFAGHIKINKLYNLNDSVIEDFQDTNGNTLLVDEGSVTIMTYEGMLNLGFNEDTANSMKGSIGAILMQDTSKDDVNSKSDKEAERERLKLNTEIEELLGKALRGTKINIEDLGLDYMCLDEAHACKKVFTSVRGEAEASTSVKKDGDKAKATKATSQYKINSGKPSSTAIKGFTLCQYIQNNFQGNTQLLTATPFTNSPLEVFSMLAMVGYRRLEQMTLNNLTNFFDTFVDVSYELVINAALNPERKQVILGFNNLLVLQQLVRQFINHKTGESVGVKRPNKYVLPYTKMKSEGTLIDLPENEKVNTVIPLTPLQYEYMSKIKDYAENKISKDELCSSSNSSNGGEDEDEIKSEESVEIDEGAMDENEKRGVRLLLALNYSRNVAFSPYLFDCGEGLLKPTAKQFIETSGKLTFVVESIRSIKEHHEKTKTPMSGVVIYSERGVKFFPLIREYLIENLGFKPHEVGIISSQIKTPVEKGVNDEEAKEYVKNLFLGKRFNKKTLELEPLSEDERCKVLIGSATIREGINLQAYSSTLFNCFLSFNPTDIQQLEGRIYRQGNAFKNVRIVNPLMIDSADIFMFQKLEEKTSRINSIFDTDGQTNILKTEEFNPKELKYSLIKNPRVIAEMELMEDIETIAEDITDKKADVEKLERFIEQVKNIEYRKDDLKELLKDVRSKFVDKPLKEQINAIQDFWRTKLDEQKRYVKQGSYDSVPKDMIQSPYSSVYKPYWFDDFNMNVRNVDRFKRDYLIPRNVPDKDVADYIGRVKFEIDDLEKRQTSLTSEEAKDRKVMEVLEKREKLQIKEKSVDELVKDFARMNYLLDDVTLPKVIEPKVLMCPPVDASGVVRIDSEGLMLLDECIKSQPQTKYLNSKEIKTEDGTVVYEYTEKRKELHKEIIDKLVGSALCTDQIDPIAIIMGGAPGSGKSTFLKNNAPYLQSDKIWKVDADEVRSMLPEYKGWNAPVTHEEAKDVVNMLLDRYDTPCKHDLLYDGTMSNVKKYRPLIKRLKKLGYKVFLVFMEIPKEESIKRALKRYQDNNAKNGEFGRYVPISVIEDFYGTGDEAFQMLKKEVDGYIKVDGIKQLIEERGGIQLPENRSYAGLGTNILPKVEKVIETAKPTNKVDFTEKRLKALKISLRFSKDKAMVEKRIKALEISLKVLANKKPENSSVDKTKDVEYDWDDTFTSGPSKGQKLSENVIDYIDVFDDFIYNLEFKDGGNFQANTKETVGLLSITDNPVKLAVILDNDVSSTQKIIRRLQKLAENSGRVIVDNNDESRSERRSFPYLLVSPKDANKYTISEKFQGKLDTPRQARLNNFREQLRTIATFVDEKNSITYKVRKSDKTPDRFEVVSSSPRWKEDTIEVFVSQEDAINHAKLSAGILKEEDPEKGFMNKTEARKPSLLESNLLKELNKLQRDLNSSRLSTYNEGDDSDEANALKRERESKLTRFNEVLATLNELDSKKMAKGGSVSDQEIFEQQFGKM